MSFIFKTEVFLAGIRTESTYNFFGLHVVINVFCVTVNIFITLSMLKVFVSHRLQCKRWLNSIQERYPHQHYFSISKLQSWRTFLYPYI